MKDLKDLFDGKLMISLRQFEKEAGKPTKLTIKKICAYFGVDYKDYI